VKKMNKRERLEAAIDGRQPDRPPVALWRHWPGDDQDAEALASAHLGWQRDWDWDLLKVSPASSYCLVDWGVEDRWEGSLEGTRTYTRRVVEQVGDWSKLPPLDPGQGMLAVQLQALRLIGRGLDDDTPFLATIFSPLAQAKNLAGEERMLSDMRSQPAEFQRGLETITRSTITFIEEAKKTGIGGIFYAVQHARFPLLNLDEYRQFGQSYDKRILAAAADLPFNMLHIHSRDTMFDQLAGYPVQFVNWHDRDSGPSLARGLEVVKGAVSGGVSRWSLYQDTVEETIVQTRDALQQTAGRRLMLGVGCVAMTNTPLRNIRALRESAGGG